MTTTTIALLIYKSPRWLEWVLQQLSLARNDAPFRVLVVQNDPVPSVRDFVRSPEFHAACRDLNVLVEAHWNQDPHEYAMARVYRAWNKCVELTDTDDVVLVNSDMAFADGWLDELLALRDHNPKCLPTSLLVESGRLASGLPDYVANFGRDPSSFDAHGFAARARELVRDKPPAASFSGGLFMPVLWRKSDFEAIGGYPIQGAFDPLAADAVAFNKAASALGLEHRTAVRSIVYHAQLGETEEP